MNPFLRSVMAARDLDHEKRLATTRSLDALPHSEEPRRRSPGTRPARRTRQQVVEARRALAVNQCLSVLELHREGVGLAELATRLGRTERTVFRLLKRARANPLSPTPEAR